MRGGRVRGGWRRRIRGIGLVVPAEAILASLLVALTAVACGEVRLVDPLETNASLEGVVFEVSAHDDGDVFLDFRAHAYGIEDLNRDLVIRYLDAGELFVEGWPARRRFVRVGQPEYVLRTSVEEAPHRIDVRVGGSSVVPPCEIGLVLPIAALPVAGLPTGRSDALTIPLPTLPAHLGGGERVSARVHLVDGTGTVRSTSLAPVRTQAGMALRLSPEHLEGLRTGPVELSLRVEWSRTIGWRQGTGSACAPSLRVRSVYEVVRRVQLVGAA